MLINEATTKFVNCVPAPPVITRFARYRRDRIFSLKKIKKYLQIGINIESNNTSIEFE